MHTMIDLFKKTEKVFWEAVSCTAFRGSTFAAYSTGVESLYLNPVIQEAPLQVHKIDETIEEICSFYDPHSLPWIWIFQEDFLTKDFEETLEERGLELIDESVTMALCLDSNDFDHAKQGFVIEECRINLKDWGKCMEAFDSDEVTIRQYILAHQRQKTESSCLRHFVGYDQGIPVSSATLSFSQYGTRLDDIATRPSYQRQGYASAMIAHVLRQAKSLGAKHCFLESSSDGLELYKRIGFKPIFTNKVYGFVEEDEGLNQEDR